jgi:hypothetical protein
MRWRKALEKEKRTPKGRNRPARAWGIVVRLANGSTLYYSLDALNRDREGNPLERWGRQSQAYGFPSEQEARRVAAAMQTNSAAEEYAVVLLPLVRHKS